MKKKEIRVCRAVLDERTPEVCRISDGLDLDFHDVQLPHDTQDPKNLCRCVIRSETMRTRTAAELQEKGA